MGNAKDKFTLPNAVYRRVDALVTTEEAKTLDEGAGLILMRSNGTMLVLLPVEGEPLKLEAVARCKEKS